MNRRPRLQGTHPEVSQLLNDAQEAAVRDLGTVKDTSDNRDRLVALTRAALLRQVAVGLWERHGVAALEEMVGVVVSWRTGNALLGESRIKIEYDFSHTALPGLLVDAKPRRAN